VRFASLAIILVCIVLLVRLLPVDRLTAMLSAKVGELGVWGPVAFGAVYIVAAVLFVPGAALTLAAGAVFGLVMGTIVVSIASTTAAAASFLIGRYVARDAVHHWAARNPRFAAIDRAIGQGGWKIIALLRLSPAVPFSLGNYLFGITAIRFWPYVLTSWLAMLPGTFMYVYLGYAGRAGLAAASGGGQSRSPAQWALLAVGLAATVAVTIYVTHIARKAIKENQVMSDKAETSDNSAASAKAPASRMLVTLLLAAFSLALLIMTGCALFNRDKIAGLFGPPAVKLHETYAVKPGGPTFDHSIFNQVLHKYVSQEGGWVDYDGLAKDHAGLDEYVASLSKAPFDQMGRDQRLALLLNAYNAFTLRLILDHYPLKSIKDIPSDQRWDARRWNIGGHVWSLNQIEHGQIRPKFKEPRVHFALVCAAIGCPPLRDEAYVADRLEQQLQSQTMYVHSHGRWFQFDPMAGIVKLTSLYKWYAGDFEQVAGSILQFAARYSPPLKEAMDSGRTPRIEFLDYNWSLNSRENRP
jgi:uncharacterized membrane protein YdjX (TVP38/TMEM64 family)